MIISKARVWRLKRWQANIIYALYAIRYPAAIGVGDKVKCYGIGYPHWRDAIFTCYSIFPDGKSMVIKGCIKVQMKDFRKL